MSKIVLILLVVCGMKAIIGLHWPWEKCPCCGGKFKEHKHE
jgi:hypothetical protein